MTFQFTLMVEGRDVLAPDVADALFEAGCDDALVGSVDGISYLDFDREAPSLADAILSAIHDVESVPGVEVTRLADSDLVSMADIAERLGRTRESVRLLVSGERGAGGFPPPITNPTARYRLWRWTEVAAWIRQHLNPGMEAEEPLVTAIGTALELRRLSRIMGPEDNGRMVAAIRPLPRSSIDETETAGHEVIAQLIASMDRNRELLERLAKDSSGRQRTSAGR